MLTWLALLGLSGLSGLLTALLLEKPWAIYVAAAVPWFGLLLAILFTVYFTPYAGGGATMWPIAQLFGGTIAATTGVLVFLVARKSKH